MFDPLLRFLDRLTLLQFLLLLLLLLVGLVGYGWVRFSVYLLSTPVRRFRRFPRFLHLYNPIASTYYRAGRFHQLVATWVRRREWSDAGWSVAARLLLRLDRMEGWVVRWWGWLNWQDIHLLLLLFGGVYNLLLIPLLLLTYLDTVHHLNGFINRAPSQQMVDYTPFIRRYIHRFSTFPSFFGWDEPFAPHHRRYHPKDYYCRKALYRWMNFRPFFPSSQYRSSIVHKHPKFAYLFMVGYLGILPLQLYVLNQAASFYTVGIYEIEINTRWIQQILDGQKEVMFGVVRMNRVMALWLLFHLPLVINLLWGPITLYWPLRPW